MKSRRVVAAFLISALLALIFGHSPDRNPTPTLTPPRQDASTQALPTEVEGVTQDWWTEALVRRATRSTLHTNPETSAIKT